MDNKKFVTYAHMCNHYPDDEIKHYQNPINLCGQPPGHYPISQSQLTSISIDYFCLLLKFMYMLYILMSVSLNFIFGRLMRTCWMQSIIHSFQCYIASNVWTYDFFISLAVDSILSCCFILSVTNRTSLNILVQFCIYLAGKILTYICLGLENHGNCLTRLFSSQHPVLSTLPI